MKPGGALGHKPPADPVARGRPKVQYDLAVVKTLAACCCTLDEMAAYLHISPRTIDRLMKNKNGEFALTVAEGKAYGRATLRRKQFESALSGNTTMQIWLGKQILDQKDIPLVEVHNEASAINFTMSDTARKRIAEATLMIRKEAILAQNARVIALNADNPDTAGNSRN